MEAANWVCDDALDDHVWVSELTISCQEAKVLKALQCDFAKPMHGPVGMLRFSTPTISVGDFFEQWYDPRQIQRSYESGSCGNHPFTLR